MPDPVLECRPFCYLGDKKEVVFFEGGSKRTTPPRLWTYDFAVNRFTQLSAKNTPTGDPLTVLYLEGQDAVFALMGTASDNTASENTESENKVQPWVYSFSRNTWARLPTRRKSNLVFQRPYAQTVYSAKYGVLVNLPNIEVMRPDISKAKWY